jgi:hypothetical protein
MSVFNFSAPAELFPGRARKVVSKYKYRRFEHASEAILYAVEQLPEPVLLGAYIEIEGKRIGHQDIRTLYASETFPLKKAA